MTYAKDTLRVGFDRALKPEFHGATVISDAGLFPYLDFDEVAQPTDRGAAELWTAGPKRGKPHLRAR